MNYNLSDVLSRSIIGKAATEAAEMAMFPLETSNLMALCAASWCVGVGYKVSFYDGDSIPVNLFFIAEARSGEGKSRALKLLTKGMTKSIEEIAEKRKLTRSRLMDDFVANNDNKPEKASHTEKEMLNKELAKNHPLSHTVSDMTGAAFDNMLRDQRGWFVLKTTEQGLIDSLFMGSHTDGNANLDPFLNAFDGEYTETRRVGREGFSGTPHGGIGVISQSGSIEKMLELSGNRGLTQRFLMMLEPTKMGTRKFGRYTRELKHLPRFNGVCGGIVKGAINDIETLEFNNLKTLKIEDGAWDLIYDFKNTIEPSLGPGGKYEPAILSSMWSKFEIFCMKISATLHVIYGNTDKENISEETMVDAITIAAIMLSGVSEIAESKGIVGGGMEKRGVLEYLKDKSRIHGVDGQAIKNTLSRRKIFAEYQENKSKRVMEVVEMLVKDGKVSKQVIDGNDFYKFIKY